MTSFNFSLQSIKKVYCLNLRNTLRLRGCFSYRKDRREKDAKFRRVSMSFTTGMATAMDYLT